MLPLTSTDAPISSRLAAELAEVEARFTAELISDLPCVNSLVAHVERYRGKMLRPTLLLVGGMATAPQSELTDAHRVVAAVVEMVHMATLVHDDILDEADVRRHGATVNRLRGNETAVMLGDYLISHAYHLCSSLDRPAVSRVIADATNTVCEGELLQLANRNNWRLDEATYFEIIRRKTASLCGTCCRLAAMLSGASPEIVDGLYEYGEKLGIAFQIIDDLLDLVGQEDTVGKTLGRDLDKGKLTLPLIHFLSTEGDDRRETLLKLLGSTASETAQNNGYTANNGKARPPVGQAQAAEIRRMVIEAGSVEYARNWAARLVDQAQTAIAPLPESEAKALLADMARAVLTREY